MKKAIENWANENLIKVKEIIKSKKGAFVYVSIDNLNISMQELKDLDMMLPNGYSVESVTWCSEGLEIWIYMDIF